MTIYHEPFPFVWASQITESSVNSDYALPRSSDEWSHKWTQELKYPTDLQSDENTPRKPAMYKAVHPAVLPRLERSIGGDRVRRQNILDASTKNLTILHRRRRTSNGWCP